MTPYYQIYEEESGTYDKFSKPFYPKVFLWDCKPFANLDNHEGGDDDYQQNNHDEMIQSPGFVSAALVLDCYKVFARYNL